MKKKPNRDHSFSRTTDQILFLHRSQEHPGLRPEGHHAFLGQLHERQSSI